MAKRISIDRRMLLKSGAGLAAVAGFGSSAFAQEKFPTKPITVIVPYPPGGIADTRTRIQAEYIGTKLGQTGLTDNLPGAGGILAVRRLMAAKPDGYTLLAATSSTMVVVPLLNTTAKYDPTKDVIPVCQMFVEPAAFLVAKTSRFQSLQDIIDEAKKRPGELTYATPGVNSLYHMFGEAFAKLAGISIKHVPYAGANQYVLDMVGGRIDFASSTMGTYMQNRDQLRGLGASLPERMAKAPEVPTVAESGIKGLELPAGSGIFAPVGTPSSIVDMIADAGRKLLIDPEMTPRLEKLGLDAGYRAPDDFKKDLIAFYAKARDLIKLSGMTATDG